MQERKEEDEGWMGEWVCGKQEGKGLLVSKEELLDES